MRLATFNICSGRSGSGGSAETSQLARAVRELDVDVLALQEVDLRQDRSLGADQAAVAAEAMGCPPDGWRFAAALCGTPGGSWIAAGDDTSDQSRPSAAGSPESPGTPDSPGYGIALLSRLPVLKWSTIRLAAAPVRSPVVAGGTGGRPGLLLLRDEPRVALAAVIQTSLGSLTVVTTHLSFVPGWNVRQLRLLHQRLADLPRPLILAGDLNLPGRVPSLVTGWRPLIRERTFPAASPRVQLDHILLAGGLERPLGYQPGPGPADGHL